MAHIWNKKKNLLKNSGCDGVDGGGDDDDNVDADDCGDADEDNYTILYLTLTTCQILL